MTVAAIYREGIIHLREAGWPSDEARGAARILCDEVTGTRFSHLMQPDKALHEKAVKRWRAMLQQVARGVPLPYILRRQEFFGLEFMVDERALIPRPETEILVEAAFEKLKSHPAPTIADPGTGSGCIAISVAYALPQARVFATDASLGALELAEFNAHKLGVADRITFLPGIIGDWATPLREHRFDAILSNPPYIARKEIETLQTQVRDFEPRNALDGGADGLDCYRELAAQCKAILAPDGFFMAELGAGQFGEVCSIFEANGWQVEAPLFDFQNIARVIEARR
jgi:release factor glutamine methyltransferase